MTEIEISVVVCTYNRARLLRAALESLLALRTEGRFAYEIVVVDNGSTDDTDRVIEEVAQGAAVPVRRLREPRAGVACARNAGLRAARGRWIAFFDDDQIAEPDWLWELWTTAERTGARYVGGAVRLLLPAPVLEGLPTICRRLLGESASLTAPRRLDRRLFIGTGNLLVHREAFDRIGGFDEGLREAGEDTDLNRRLRAAGIVGWLTPTAVVAHVVPEYRLGEAYLRWASLRNGMHVARRDRKEWGGLLFPAVLVGRVGQVVLRDVPRWLGGRLTGRRRLWLEGRCQLWRAEGYFRHALSLDAEVDFRQERELFGSTSGRSEASKGAAGGPPRG